MHTVSRANPVRRRAEFSAARFLVLFLSLLLIGVACGPDQASRKSRYEAYDPLATETDKNSKEIKTKKDKALDSCWCNLNNSCKVDPKKSFKIASVNLHMFFDDTCDSGKCKKCDSSYCGFSGPFERTYNNGAATRAKNFKAHFDKLDADVVVLQEIENQNALNILQTELKSYQYAAISNKDQEHSGSFQTAVLSKFPLQVTSYDILNNFQRSRKMIRADVTINNKKIIVFGVHLQSKIQVSNETIRRKQSENAVKIISKVAMDNPNAAIVIGGDFNDTPDSATLKNLTDNNFVLVKGRSESDWWTESYQGVSQAIDHLLFYDNNVAKNYGGLCIEHHAKESDHGLIRATFSFLQ